MLLQQMVIILTLIITAVLLISGLNLTGNRVNVLLVVRHGLGGIQLDAAFS